MDLFGAEHITIWDVVRHWAGRPMLTKLLKDHGKDAVKEAALKTLKDEAVEQLPYMVAILNDGETFSVRNASDEQLLIMAQKRGIQTRGKSRTELINALR